LGEVVSLSVISSSDFPKTQLTAHLSKLRFLTQLRIGPRTWRGCSGRIQEGPSEIPALRWEGLTEPKDLAYRYAELIKRICPSLQYIRIYDWSWEFVPRRSSMPSPLRWTLRELEFEETLAMEIMSLERFSDQAAGLPSQERKHRYKPMFDDSWSSSTVEDI
jgi:hypothetical protein